MASVVDICNAALSHLGETVFVSTIDPPAGSKHAQTLGRVFADVRDEVIESHNWSFAVRRVLLASAASNDLDDVWGYAFALPSDYIRAISALPEGVPDNAPNPPPYIIEGRVLYTNVPEVRLRYVRSVSDPTLWPPKVRAAVEWALALKVWGTVRRGADARERDRIASAAANALFEAQNSDAKAIKDLPAAKPAHIRARTGYGKTLVSADRNIVE